MIFSEVFRKPRFEKNHNIGDPKLYSELLSVYSQALQISRPNMSSQNKTFQFPSSDVYEYFESFQIFTKLRFRKFEISNPVVGCRQVNLGAFKSYL